MVWTGGTLWVRFLARKCRCPPVPIHPDQPAHPARWCLYVRVLRPVVDNWFILQFSGNLAALDGAESLFLRPRLLPSFFEQVRTRDHSDESFIYAMWLTRS